MSNKLYVGNLSYQSDEDSLRELFSQYGTVTSVRIITDRETRRSKGFAFVEMESPEEAPAVLSALDGADLDGRQLKVREAIEKERPSRF